MDYFACSCGAVTWQLVGFLLICWSFYAKQIISKKAVLDMQILFSIDMITCRQCKEYKLFLVTGWPYEEEQKWFPSKTIKKCCFCFCLPATVGLRKSWATRLALQAITSGTPALCETDWRMTCNDTHTHKERAMYKDRLQISKRK